MYWEFFSLSTHMTMCHACGTLTSNCNKDVIAISKLGHVSQYNNLREYKSIVLIIMPSFHFVCKDPQLSGSVSQSARASEYMPSRCMPYQSMHSCLLRSSLQLQECALQKVSVC